jgi:acyl carrier protein
MTARFTLADLMALLTETAGLPDESYTDDPSATLDAVGLDSLAFLQLHTRVEEIHGVVLAENGYELSLGELVEAVNSALVTGQEVPA